MHRSTDPVILILGASGQVGRAVATEFGRQKLGCVVAASRNDTDSSRRFDLSRPASVERLLRAVRPNHTILTAAATSVAWCESHPDEASRINVLGTAAVASASHKVGSTLTFLSTDYVFDGTHGPDPEEEHANPVNVYGAHKLAAEAKVLDASSENLIVRTCQVFGTDPRRANFVLSTVDRLRRDETVYAPGDLFGTPTYAYDLARAIVVLTLSEAAGIWHVAGDSFLSRYELAVMAASAFGCDRRRIHEVSQDEVADTVRRPRRAGLRNGRLTKAGMSMITPLDQALADLARTEQWQ